MQYAAKFESLKAQMETYDEQMLLMGFIFGLKEDLIEPVFMQYPKTVQEAKQVAENIEIVHQGVERHESKTAKGKNQTLNKKQCKKGILGNSAVVRGQSFGGNRVSSLGPPGTALHRLAGAQHLVSKHRCAVPLQEKTTARRKGELRASLRAREARAQRAAFLRILCPTCSTLRRAMCSGGTEELFQQWGVVRGS